ncbi:MAG: DUF6340 family protein [Bacteroidales bacterium]|nr:DUF6340 family protein [Bacteroidales bacterium]
MKKFILFFTAFLSVSFITCTFQACKSRSFTTSFLVPADINIPQHIQRVGVVNRSLPERSNMFVNFLEGFISGESVFADRESSMNAIRGAVNTLNANPRFQAVLMEGEELRGTGTKQFAAPLDWETVDVLCKKYSVDALISLETFDSDIFIHRDSRQRSRKKDGRTENYTEFSARLNIRSSAGWRFYDNINKSMIDEQVFVDEKSFGGSGLTPEEALSKLPNKRSALNESGIFSGEMLAFRISPKWLNTTRNYYTRAKGEKIFRETRRVARTNQWEAAAQKWLPLTNASDNKIAARACYNMAVAEEMNGNLEEAQKWANQAFFKQRKSRHRTYLNVINKRISEQQRLREQMEGSEN